MHRAHGATGLGATCEVVDDLAERDAECRLENATLLDVASDLEHVRATTATRAESLVGRCTVSKDRRHHGGFAKQADQCGKRRFGPHHTTLALEAFEQCRLFAADVCASTYTHMNAEREA